MAVLSAGLIQAAPIGVAKQALTDETQLRVVAFTPSTDTAHVLPQHDGQHDGVVVHPVVHIDGKQALTVTFSHAIIALGEDFGAGALPESLNPFMMSPAVAGTVRWVTTSIARFDPLDEWPPELTVSVAIKPSLRAYGSERTLGEGPSGSPTYMLATRELSMSVSEVISEQAMALTNGSWDAAVEPLVRGAYEVPPDGKVVLRFSYKVEHDLLRTSLSLRRMQKADGPSGGGDGDAHTSSSGGRGSIGGGLHSSSSMPRGDGSVLDMQYTPSGAALPFSLSACRVPSARCVVLTPITPLEMDAVYELLLPADSRFHRDGGATKQPIRLSLSGLVPFAFPFKQATIPTISYMQFRPRYRRYTLWLRHGLAPSTSLASLSSALSLAPPLPMTLSRPTAASLLLEAAFDPDTTYTIHVDADAHVRDGFGLPLQASFSTFTTATVNAAFELPAVHYGRSEHVRFALSSSLSPPSTWPAAAFYATRCLVPSPCDESGAARALFTVVRPVDAPALIAAIKNRRSSQLGQDERRAFGSLSSLPAPHGLEIRRVSVGSELSQGARLVLQSARSGRSSSTSTLISAGTLGAVALGVPDGSTIVWVLDTTTNAPVRGASVKLYETSGWAPSASDVSLVTTASTNANGLVFLGASSSSHEHSAMVHAPAGYPTGQEALFLHEVPHAARMTTPRAIGQLVTDRAVYKETDDVFVKGYVRMPAGANLALLPSGSSLSLYVRWTDSNEEVVAVDADAEFGAFSATLRVPLGANYRDTTLALRQTPGPNGERRTTLAATTFTIADPRPPTVTLSVSTVASDGVGDGDGDSRSMSPNSTFGLRVSTATMSGVPVSDAVVVVRWRLERAQRVAPCTYCPLPFYDEFEGVSAFADGVADATEADADAVSGEETINTGADGVFSGRFRPSGLRSERLGDTLSLEFEWVGPTRELLSSSATVPVALSDESISISVPEHAQLPGHVFDLEAEITTHPSLGGARLTDVPLEFLLFELDGTVTEETGGEHGDVWFSNEAPDALPKTAGFMQATSCILKSTTAGSRAPSCAMSLPSIGRFVGAVCALDSDGVRRRVCSAVRLGRSEASWRERPLHDYLQMALSPKLRNETYAVGEMGTLTLYNPLSTPLLGLLAWGNALSRSVLVTEPLPPGHVEINFRVGGECVGGCMLALHLAAQADDDRTLPVPASPLLEPRAPMLASFSMGVDVREAERRVSVAVALDESVARPGEQSGVTLTLTDASGAPVEGEVCLFAVDKSILALRPHPLAPLSSVLSPQLRGASYAHRSSYSSLVSAAALNATAGRLADLLAADPWVSVSWPLDPSRGVVTHSLFESATVDDALANFETPITAMPNNRMYKMVDGFGGGNFVGDMPVMMAAAMPESMSMDDSAGDMMMARADSTGGGPIAPMGRSEMSMFASEAGSSNGGGGAGGGALHVRSHFVTTPLFMPAVRVGASGTVHVPWQLPDNAGAFEVRAYVATSVESGSHFGSGVATQLVRKPVTLTASVPRIARVGDELRCGVTVTGSPELPSNTALAVTLSVPQTDAGSESETRSTGALIEDLKGVAAPTPLALAGASRLPVTLSPLQTIEVVFTLKALSLGDAVLTATVDFENSAAVHSGSLQVADALELKLPVLGMQPQVSVATSRALQASAEPSVWTEGVAFPAAVPGSGSISLAMGVGRLPAVAAVADTLGANWKDATDKYATVAIGVVAAVAMLQPYYPAQDELRQHLLRLLPSAVESLSSLTDASIGLRFSNWASANNYVDVQLNAFGLFVARKAALAGVPLPHKFKLLTSTWSAATARALEQQVEEETARGGKWRSMHTLALCRLALGTEWTPSSKHAAEALDMQVLRDGIDELDVFGQAAVALSLLLPPSPSSDAVTARPRGVDLAVAAILRSFEARTRVTARTAYIAYSSGAASAAGGADNALALAAFAAALTAGMSPDAAANVDKLANWVARGGDSSSVYAGLAMADYDLARSSTDADISLALNAGSTPLAYAQLRTAGPPPRTLTLPWSALPQPPPPLLFVTSGHGEASVALSLTFTPANLLLEPVSRGISVQKIIRRYDGALSAAVGPALTSVPLGQVVSVTIQVTLADDASNLLIDDWLPAGLEAIDPNANAALTDGAAGATASSSNGFPGGRLGGFGGIAQALLPSFGFDMMPGCMWWWRCVSFSRETRKDRVSFYSGYAYAGTHTLSFEAMAVTRGTFVLPPSRAMLTLQPEVMGLSAAGHVIVGTPPRSAPSPPAQSPSTDGARGAGESASAPTILPNATAGANDTVYVRGGAEVEVHFGVAGGKGVASAYALTPGNGTIARNAVSLHAVGADVIALRLRAPHVQEATCSPLFLTASADGSAFGSRRLSVWVLPSSTPLARRLAATSLADGHCASFFDNAPYIESGWTEAHRIHMSEDTKADLLVAVGLPLVALALALVAIGAWALVFKTRFVERLRHRRLSETQTQSGVTKQGADEGAEVAFASCTTNSSGASTPDVPQAS